MVRKSQSKFQLSAEERIGEVAQRWFLIEPLLFSMYCTHHLEADRSMAVPLRCGDGKIEYNPDLIDHIPDSELADRLKVEALRILLKHPYQRQPFRARLEILYLASNLTILDNMGGPKAFDFELVPRWLFDAMPKGKTFEEYYGLLNRLIPQKEVEELSFGLTLSGNLSSVDNTDSENAKCADDEEGKRKLLLSLCHLFSQAAALWSEDSIKVVDINLTIMATMAGPSKGWGTLPMKFVECVKASLVPPVNIANILKGFKKTILSQRRDLTRMRPSRRYGFDQMGSKYSYTTNVLVALDVSGSVDSDMLSRMLGLINRIFKQGVENIDVIQFDAQLKGEPTPIRKAIKTFKVIGRGGTDFQPAADYYFEHNEYDGLIYITDGIAPDPVVSPEFKNLPVTWIITDDDLIPSIRHGWPSG